MHNSKSTWMEEHTSTPKQNLSSCTQIKIHWVFGWIEFLQEKKEGEKNEVESNR